MGSAATGELFTHEQYDAMSAADRERLQIVPLTPEESEVLQPMKSSDRRTWLKSKKAELRKRHKVERQRRKAGRR